MGTLSLESKQNHTNDRRLIREDDLSGHDVSGRYHVSADNRVLLDAVQDVAVVGGRGLMVGVEVDALGRLTPEVSFINTVSVQLFQKS